MEIICSNCQGKFKIADDKIPPGKSASFPCPKCRTPLTVNSEAPAPRAKVPLNEIDTSAYNPTDRPFDFVEEEGKTALVCEQQPLLRKTITDTLELMEYQITVADNARDALKRMRYHVYDIVVVNEDFDTDNPDANGVLIYLERLGMSVRRNIFVAMITGRHRTMDNMTAFMKSVNLIINTKNIEDFGKIMSRGLTDHLAFYQIYREKLKETGRA
ncbi:MAG: zinc-ribbon domain-containing protein [Deltaproteobacteria bacterium]|nr:zinc-ribbon domain-containing protein [Deltaproteobacteria bacterium]